VVCMSPNSTTRCYAQSPSGPEMMSPVVSWCELQSRLNTGEYLIQTCDGWFHECDYGGEPTSFKDVACFFDSWTHVVCFGGSEGWYTEVMPSCAPTAFTDPAWGDGTCDKDGDPGAHDFTSVSVVPDGFPWLGEATTSSDAFKIVPECAAPATYQAGNPFSC
jgi:hypothetical protein